MHIKDFYEVEDKDLMKYLCLSGNVNREIDVVIQNNEEIFGFFRNSTRVRINPKGVIYTSRTLEEYIIYDKVTKKVRMSKTYSNVYNDLLEYFFYDTHIIKALNIKVTKTLCKKIIEGSINCIGDFIKYVRSYVVKKKDMPIELIKRYIGDIFLLNVIEDPENIDNFKQLNDAQVPRAVVVGSLFTFKIADINEQRDRYQEWCNQQSEKLITFQRRGDGQIRRCDGAIIACEDTAETDKSDSEW